MNVWQNQSLLSPASGVRQLSVNAPVCLGTSYSPRGMGIFVFHCKSVCVSTCRCTSVCVCAHIRIIYTGCRCIAFISCLRGTLLCACSPQVSFLLIASLFSGIYYKSTLHTFLFLIRILILGIFRFRFFSFCTRDINKCCLIFKET